MGRACFGGFWGTKWISKESLSLWFWDLSCFEIWGGGLWQRRGGFLTKDIKKCHEWTWQALWDKWDWLFSPTRLDEALKFDNDGCQTNTCTQRMQTRGNVKNLYQDGPLLLRPLQMEWNGAPINGLYKWVTVLASFHPIGGVITALIHSGTLT